MLKLSKRIKKKINEEIPKSKSSKASHPIISLSPFIDAQMFIEKSLEPSFTKFTVSALYERYLEGFVFLDHLRLPDCLT